MYELPSSIEMRSIIKSEKSVACGRHFFYESTTGGGMKIHYHLTEEDFVNFNLYHSRHSKAATRPLMVQRIVSPILFIAVAFLFSTIGGIPLPFSLTTFGILSILWVLFYPKYFYHLIKRNAKKMIREGRNDGLLGDHTMSLTEGWSFRFHWQRGNKAILVGNQRVQRGCPLFLSI